MIKNGKKKGKVGKGHPPVEHQFPNNPAGRPKGTKNFKTIFEQAAKEVAEALRLGKEPDAVQVELVKRGVREGLKGNFQFYKDLIDRLYGKTTEKVEHSGEIAQKVDLKGLENYIKWRKKKN